MNTETPGSRLDIELTYSIQGLEITSSSSWSHCWADFEVSIELDAMARLSALLIAVKVLHSSPRRTQNPSSAPDSFARRSSFSTTWLESTIQHD